MSPNTRILLSGALLAVALPQAARAAIAEPNLFAGRSLSDEMLAGQRAGYAPTAQLTRRAVASIADDEARSVERLTSSASVTSMDVWWSSVGADLITANVLGR